MLPRHRNIVVSLGLVAGLCVSSLVADHYRESAPHRCEGCATGQCQASSLHGYWKPSWRQWPGATPYRGYKKTPPEMKVPGNELPNKYDEIRLTPRTRAGEAANAASPETRSSAPPLGGGALSPIVPNDDGPNVPSLDTPPTSPFMPGPETAPSNGADPFSPGPPLNNPAPNETPAPTNDLFDDMLPLPDAPSVEPDDDLFDDMGQLSPKSPETESVPRSIKSRSIARTDNARPTLATPLPSDGNQLTDLVTPTIQVDFQQGMVAPTLTPPLLLETPIQPTPIRPTSKPLATPKAAPPTKPTEVLQVAHVEEQAAVNEAAEAGQNDNPLRRTTTNVTSKHQQPATSHSVSTPKIESTAHKRLVRSRNPFR